LVEQKQIEKFINILLDNSQNALLLFDKDSRLVYCSNEFLRLTSIENFERVRQLTL